jgi:hypothetical protein
MLSLRIAPQLADGEPLRLLLDGESQRNDEEALRTALARLRNVLTVPRPCSAWCAITARAG